MLSWNCPHEVKKYCKRLNKKCQPGSRGCVLCGQVKFIDLNKGANELDDNIQVLDLRQIPLFERHEKIFQLWDTLKTGESLKIINDHDPKPLWYQFEVEYKGKYEWGYEQKGPKDWIVLIKKVVAV